MYTCPECGRSVRVEDAWCPQCGAAMAGPADPRDWNRVEQTGGPSRRYSTEDIERPWKLWARCVIASVVLLFAVVVDVVVVAGGAATGNAGWKVGLSGGLLAVALGLGAMAAGIAAIVFWHMFLYRAWDQAQAFTTRTTPARAVGFLFIPFFNYYWLYVAYVHLARAMNVHLEQRATPSEARVNEGLVIAAYVFLLIYIVANFLLPPFVSPVFFLLFAICALILAFQYKATAVVIATQDNWSA